MSDLHTVTFILFLNYRFKHKIGVLTNDDASVNKMLSEVFPGCLLPQAQQSGAALSINFVANQKSLC